MAEDSGDAGNKPTRRQFLQWTALTSLGAAVLEAGCQPELRAAQATPAPSDSLLLAAPPLDRVRVGWVGVGNRGSFMLSVLTMIDGVDIVAICDLVPARVASAQQAVVAAGKPLPDAYDQGPLDYQRLCDRQDIDLVVVATPWNLHTPICVTAMRSGKHAAVEVPAAITVEQCWELVETAEKTRRHCVMLENCCYDRREMLMLNLVRQGVLGEILHGECGYRHDLRAQMFDDNTNGLWRRAYATLENCNWYPTHGLGPIAQCMNINRGNQLSHLVSMSSPARGLQLMRDRHLSPTDGKRTEVYICGDQSLTLIQTAMGQTIYLVRDVNSPRPYSRINTLQGTSGLLQGYPDQIYVEGRSPVGDTWETSLDAWYAQYEHPLWQESTVQNFTGGHGGMDYLVLWRLIACLRNGLPTDINVYDTAAWSCMTELTAQSVAQRSRTIDVPDFTRGRWQATAPLGIVTAT
jgi:hypothetical protein